MKIDNITIHGGNQQFEGKPNKVIIEDVVRKMNREEETGLSIEFDGYHLLISDRETSCIYKEADTGEYATEFPLMTESKLVMED